jgi:hypothetical protein
MASAKTPQNFLDLPSFFQSQSYFPSEVRKKEYKAPHLNDTLTSLLKVPYKYYASPPIFTEKFKKTGVAISALEQAVPSSAEESIA